MSDGDRIAKVLSRAGVASRREAERMIAEGRVRRERRADRQPGAERHAKDRITVDGKPVEAPIARGCGSITSLPGS
jgi:23S rRNA pseudouridine2605 synthase